MKTNNLNSQSEQGQDNDKVEVKNITLLTFKIIFIFILVIAGLVSARALFIDTILESNESLFNDAYLMEERAREGMESAILAHEQSKVVLCKAYTNLRAYKQLKNIKLANPDYNPCLILIEREKADAGEGEAGGKEKTGVETKPTPALKQVNVIITTYNPVPGQTDASPCIGASGKDQCKMAKEGAKIIAVSRDLRGSFPYGSRVFVESDNPQLQGCYFVEDTMNARFTNRIDVFQLDKKNNTSGKGVLSNKTENCK